MIASSLPSWNETPRTQAILDFVATVTDEQNPNYVPPQDRIATFDNDGTLWCEKPGYIQLFFAIARLKAMATADPDLQQKAAFKAAVKEDMSYFASLYPDKVQALIEIIYDTHAGMSQAEFEQQAQAFLSSALHPRYQVPFQQLTYQPMRELVDYLHEHDFKVFIASAGGMSFVRTVSEEIYNISRERVIGSNIAFETVMTEDGPTLMRKPGLVEPLDDGVGKPVNIELHIGRKPILAFGNANGDLHMLWLAETNRYPSLSLLLHHDDGDREYAYDRGNETVMKLAKDRNWSVVSMKDDFKTIFKFENTAE